MTQNPSRAHITRTPERGPADWCRSHGQSRPGGIQLIGAIPPTPGTRPQLSDGYVREVYRATAYEPLDPGKPVPPWPTGRGPHRRTTPSPPPEADRLLAGRHPTGRPRPQILALDDEGIRRLGEGAAVSGEGAAVLPCHVSPEREPGGCAGRLALGLAHHQVVGHRS